MSIDKSYTDAVLKGPPEIKQAEICRHFKTKDGTCYECRLEAERNRLELELKQEAERCTKVMRLLVQVTDILSMGRTPDRASAALKVIYQWLHDNKPDAQEGDTKHKSLERSLLEMWHSQGIKEIYKYKNRIKVYKREGLIRYELFTDLTCGLLFKDVEDTANYQDATPEDFKVRVDVLLATRRSDNERMCTVNVELRGTEMNTD